jgi:hypothetical protein
MKALFWLGIVSCLIEIVSGIGALLGSNGHPYKAPPSHPNDETREDAELVRDVRSRPQVLTGLKRLAQGSDRWLREQATLALTPKDQRRVGYSRACTAAYRVCFLLA